MTAFHPCQRGKNQDPVYISARGRKAKSFSPWARGPMVNSPSAQKAFAARERTDMPRECPLCGRHTSGGWCCGIDLTAARPWRMSPDRIRSVHVLAMGTKGLDEETYRLRLEAVGVTTSKDLDRAQFTALVQGLRALPDAPRKTRKP
jgi:hypothetical protein